MCAAAARETKRLRLGAGVVVLPFHHPIKVAEQAGMVDCLSGGRLLLGVGRGYQPPEFAGFGQRLEDSQARFEQGLHLLQRALREDSFSYTTSFWGMGQNVTIWPKPVQRPIPLWAACISDVSFERYGQLGIPILTFPSTVEAAKLKEQVARYREAFVARGRDASDMRIGFAAFTYVEPDRARADRVFEGAMDDYFGLLDRLTRVEGAAEADQQVYDRIPTTGRVTGDPAAVIDRVHWVRDEFGVTDLINLTQFAGALSHAQVLASMRLFAEEVMPAFSQVGVAGTAS
jgi:alkanesulfonate monooxygenase SsuD/methylene tetrahydromethanopterin reductase-like flavin-dependent oxidoreductase (luciferase family)